MQKENLKCEKRGCTAKNLEHLTQRTKYKGGPENGGPWLCDDCYKNANYSEVEPVAQEPVEKVETKADTGFIHYETVEMDFGESLESNQ